MRADRLYGLRSLLENPVFTIVSGFPLVQVRRSEPHAALKLAASFALTRTLHGLLFGIHRPTPDSRRGRGNARRHRAGHRAAPGAPRVTRPIR
jgi:hypothetical protein